MAYQYMMRQIPPTIVVKQKEHQRNEAAYCLLTIAKDGNFTAWTQLVLLLNPDVWRF